MSRILLTVEEKHLLFWSGLILTVILITSISMYCYYKTKVRKQIKNGHYDKKYLEAESHVSEHRKTVNSMSFTG